MRRGPPPKPTTLRLVQSGGKPRARHAKRGNPPSSPGDGIGPPPEHLNERQSAAWVALAAGAPVGTLAPCDRPLLETYVVISCAHSAMVATLNAASAAELPRVACEVRKVATLMRSLAGDLGFTPAGRLRMAPPTPPDNDPLSRFLK